MAGITTSPQFRESPETAKLQDAGFSEGAVAGTCAQVAAGDADSSTNIDSVGTKLRIVTALPANRELGTPFSRQVEAMATRF